MLNRIRHHEWRFVVIFHQHRRILTNIYGIGTTGGAGGKTVTVNTLADFKAAAGAAGPAIIILASSITDHGMVKVKSDKTILGSDSSVVMTGVGLYIVGVKNVIVRNLTIKKVLATDGDAITIMRSTNIWIDHVDLSSDRDHGKGKKIES